MKVLIACEFSGIVRDAFARHGHDAWSCDLLESERPGNHIKGNVLEHLNEGWDLMVAHPPCTYLTLSGVRHLYDDEGNERFAEMAKAAAFFNRLKAAPIRKIAIENPTPHSYAKRLIGRYQQAIQPWEFGVPETKRTCFWLIGLPPLMATIIEVKRHPKCHLVGPGKDRWKIRSRTPEPIAEEMARQWGGWS